MLLIICAMIIRPMHRCKIKSCKDLSTHSRQKGREHHNFVHEIFSTNDVGTPTSTVLEQASLLKGTHLLPVCEALPISLSELIHVDGPCTCQLVLQRLDVLVRDPSTST